MKYRIMTEKEVLDFDKLTDAQAKFDTEKSRVVAAKPTQQDIDDGKAPSVHIHKCYHDQHPPRPCEVIEQVIATKKV